MTWRSTLQRRNIANHFKWQMWDKTKEYSHDKSLFWCMIHCHTLFLSRVSICLPLDSGGGAYRTCYRTKKWNKHCGLSVQKPTSIFFLSMASRNFRNILEKRERERHALTWEVLRMATENEETAFIYQTLWTEQSHGNLITFCLSCRWQMMNKS